jgi:hypothetical protein
MAFFLEDNSQLYSVWQVFRLLRNEKITDNKEKYKSEPLDHNRKKNSKMNDDLSNTESIRILG